MAEYITTSDVQNRLTLSGIMQAADEDLSGSGVSTSEESAVLTPAIKYAGAIVDSAVASFITPAGARSQGNQWLKDRCLDIAAYRVASNGARDAPERVRADYDFAIDQLDLVRSGKLSVPGLSIPTPYNTRDTGVSFGVWNP